MARLIVMWSAVALLTTGCSGARPLHKGPDVAKVPEGFIYDRIESARNLFPGRRKVLACSYVTRAADDGLNSSITITQYDGPTTAREVEDAVRQEERRDGYARYGPIESITMDQREGLGWTETQPGSQWSEGALTYRAVVSYPEATYLVEFYASHKRFMDPSLMKETIASFTVGK